MKIALITYHSAYNFGSVFQAYATQELLSRWGHEVHILNYRTKYQRRFYGVICWNNGIKRFVKSVLQLPQIRQKLIREKKYEDFIRDFLYLTEEFSEPEDAKKFKDDFDLYISGSDQIWNKHSNELYNAPWKYMDPYLLTFTDKKKISYASSLNDSLESELGYIIEPLKKFDHISFREDSAAKMMGRLLAMPVETVLDPTLMLEKKDWLSLVPSERIIDDDYILYYSLRGMSDVSEDIENLKKQNTKVIVIAPMSPVKTNKHVINMGSIGPFEFLRLVRDAKLIVTTSYHGTLFSINFQKPFYAIRSNNPLANIRIDNILKKLCLNDRSILSVSDLSFSSVDYPLYAKNLLELRKKSEQYLFQSILS